MGYLRHFVHGFRALLAGERQAPRSPDDELVHASKPAGPASRPVPDAGGNSLSEGAFASPEFCMACVEHSPHAKILADEKGRYIDANPAAAAMAGYTREELLQLSIPDLLDPCSLEAGLQHFQRLFTEGKATGEFIFRHKNGERRWWSVAAVKLSDTRFLAICTDITQQKQAEQALLESEWKFQALFEKGPIGVAYHRMLFDETGRAVDYLFLDANESYRRLTGVDPRGKRATEAFPGLERDSFDWIGTFARVARTGEQIQFEQFLESNSRWYDCVAYRYKPDHFVAAFTEVTERKRAEAELRRNELRQAKVFANIGDVVAILDLNGINRFKSPNIERCFGWRPEEVLGTSAWNNIHPDDHERTHRFMAELLAVPNSTGSIECRYRCKDDSYKWIECVGANLTHDPDIQGVLLNYHDISARKQAEAQREALESQFQQAQKMDSIGRLAGGIAHDFNNMLAATLLQLNLLGSNPSLDRDARQAIKDLEEGARRAAHLTRQLLMFSRRAPLQLKSVELNQVVENLLKMLRRVIGENYSLEFSPRGQIPLIEADAGMIEQVLLNLAVNARDAMPSGGAVRICTYRKEWTHEACQGNPKRREGAFVCLEVSDAGCGIPPTNLATIFEPFFTTKEVGQGTGLGLSTVDGIVCQHKGWVEVQSELGRGSSFQVFLPPAHASSAPSVPEEKPGSVPPGRETVLLVEDELAVRIIVGKSLEQLGYRVVSASSPAEALVLWQKQGEDIQLLLTDMMMPGGMTGLELCQKLHQTRPKLPVVIMSGYCKDLMSTGADADSGIEFLQKPFAVPDLALVLRRRLERS